MVASVGNNGIGQKDSWLGGAKWLSYGGLHSDAYYVAYKAITLSCILFMFIEIIFIHCHSCVMFVMKFMSMCND